MLCTLTVDDHTSASRQKRYMLGGEPILTRDGGDARPTATATTPTSPRAGSAPSLGKHVLLAYLPPRARPRSATELAVSYMEELYPVTVGSVDSTPLFDPANERIKLHDRTSWSASSGCPTSAARSSSPTTRRPSTTRSLGYTVEPARGVRRRAGHPGRQGRPAARRPC